MTDEGQSIETWLDSAEESLHVLRSRWRAGGVPDDSMLALLRKFPLPPGVGTPELPAEIRYGFEERTSVLIKTHVLREQMEMAGEEAEAPLPLVRALALLGNLAEHLAALDSALSLVRKAWRQLSRGNSASDATTQSVSVLGSMRDFLFGGTSERLDQALERQCRAAHLAVVCQGALNSAGERFALELAEEFNPEEIIAAVRAHKPQAGREDFWRRYEKQADRLTPQEIESRLARHLTTAVKELFHENLPL